MSNYHVTIVGAQSGFTSVYRDNDTPTDRVMLNINGVDVIVIQNHDNGTPSPNLLVAIGEPAYVKMVHERDLADHIQFHIPPVKG